MKLKVFIFSVFYAIIISLPAFIEVSLFENFNDSNKKSYCAVAYDENIPYCGKPEIGEEPAVPEGGSDEIEEYNTFLEAYFANLTTNYGNNQFNSCGYVAIGMLLSYYDTYLNNDIIPDVYEQKSEGYETNMNRRKNSPGIRFDEFSFSKNKYDDYQEKNREYYYDYVKIYKKHSLHAQLISIGDEYFNLYRFDTISHCGTFESDIINVIRKYLELQLDYKQFVDYDFNFCEKKGQEDIKKYIIAEIDKGYPVLIGVANDTEKHICIAYAHIGNEILCHLGFDNRKIHIPVENVNFTHYDFAMTLKIYKSHTHSDNYVVEDENGIINYCYCDHNIISYKQQKHTYTDHYLKCNSNAYHYAYCVCGDKIEEEHIWQGYVNPLKPGTYAQCKYCLFLKKLKDDEFIDVPAKPTKREEEYEES